jgi:hypothetical protein
VGTPFFLESIFYQPEAMITKQEWNRLKRGSVIKYTDGARFKYRTVLSGPADCGCTNPGAGGITLVKVRHSRFHNPTTTYFWNDLKDKIEYTGLRMKHPMPTSGEEVRAKEMFGLSAMDMVQERLDDTKACWEHIQKLVERKRARSLHYRAA